MKISTSVKISPADYPTTKGTKEGKFFLKPLALSIRFSVLRVLRELRGEETNFGQVK